MPNTLCHFAVQGPAGRFITNKSATLWILTGCILPDIPWMVQRVLLPLHLFNPYDVRLYVTVQASLVFCLVLSFALSLFTEGPVRVFAIVGVNCLCHLLLDTIQIKWGNGVHLFAPFTWKLLQFNLLWSENIIFTICSGIGFLYIILIWKKTAAEETSLVRPSWIRAAGIFCCLLIYLFAPLHYMPDLEKADNRYIHTLRDIPARTGKPIAFDRVHFSASTRTITTFTGERIFVRGRVPKQSGLLSLQGSFVTDHAIGVTIFHRNSIFRAVCSAVGISLFLLLWAQSLFNRLAVRFRPAGAPSGNLPP